MRFSVLALDFDGTIAKDDILDPQVRMAAGELRAQGIVIVLVTGRILDDLRRVAGDLHFVDAIVAENGAVVEFPDTGYLTVDGQPPSKELLEALTQDGIRFRAGRVVVEAAAGDSGRILAAIRRLELPLVLAFNRGRVMVLPQAISKATGVKQALAILRLSPHNAVAIGDGENDHELLQACEVGVAVAWASEALKNSADYVLPGSGPPAVVDYMRAIAMQRQLPVPTRVRRQTLLGHAVDGQSMALAVRGRNVLVAGDPKSGKSWVTGLVCEQLILQGYCVCVLDPEGDYLSLEALPGVTVLGGADPLPKPKDLLRALRHADVSVVIDVSHASHEEKSAYIRHVLPALATLRYHTGVPHRIVIDEAHHFLQGADVLKLLDFETNGYTLVSYQSSKLPREVLAASQAIIVTRESDPSEVRALFGLCESCGGRKSESEWAQLLGDLTIGEAVVLPITEEAQGEARRIRLTPRLTPHVRHLAKYIDIPVQDARAFVFSPCGANSGRRARTLREFVESVEILPLEVLDGHLRRGDFSRWMTEVFGDYPLGKAVREIEEDYRRGRVRSVATNLALAVRSRYEFLDPVPRNVRPTSDEPAQVGAPATPAVLPQSEALQLH